MLIERVDRRKYFVVILVLGALTTISPFSIDMYLPGFPAIAKDLRTTVAQVQFSLTSYLIGISLGQLIYGPLLDRFGRKRPLYVGLLIYILASVVCALTTTTDSFIIARFFQAIGGCVGIVAAQALVRDIFPVSESAKVFSLLILVVSVSPMIAPTVGGYVTAAFGWHYVFITLALIATLITISLPFALPDGKLADPSLSLKPKAVLTNFYTVLKQPQFLTYTLISGMISSGVFAYISGSPDVFINIYKLTEKEYGWLFAFLAFGLIGATQLNHLLLKRFSSEQIIHIALIYQCIAGISLSIGVYFHWFNIAGIISLLFIFLTGQGLVSPNSSALALAPFSKHAGSASALLGSFRMGFGGLISGVVSLLHDRTALPMVAVMAICAIIGYAILLLSRVIFPSGLLLAKTEPVEI